jgi:hypothetical protein
VRVAQGLVLEKVVGPKSVGQDEWLEVEVDLSKYAGRTVRVDIENFPNDWRNEWAYWNQVKIESF